MFCLLTIDNEMSNHKYFWNIQISTKKFVIQSLFLDIFNTWIDESIIDNWNLDISRGRGGGLLILGLLVLIKLHKSDQFQKKLDSCIKTRVKTDVYPKARGGSKGPFFRKPIRSWFKKIFQKRSWRKDIQKSWILPPDLGGFWIQNWKNNPKGGGGFTPKTPFWISHCVKILIMSSYFNFHLNFYLDCLSLNSCGIFHIMKYRYLKSRISNWGFNKWDSETPWI